LSGFVKLKTNIMYGETIQQEKAYDMPTTIHEPELQRIIEALHNAINRYDDIVCETRSKLQIIKRYDEPINASDGVKDKQPESALEEVNRLLYRLKELNDKAQTNLSHLREIV
jgi:hypothetical protein